MRYQGGKHSVAKDISKILNVELEGKRDYYEPFVGSAYVTTKIQTSGVKIASDYFKPLIEMWVMLQNGWIPPEYIDYETYKDVQDDTLGFYPDYLKSFVGFGSSFGGKYFGGYARTKGRNFTAESKRALLKKVKKLNDVIFVACDYKNLFPSWGSVVYCDPPYKNTTPYSHVQEDFCHLEFWDTIRKWEIQFNARVFVSEFTAPDDFEVIWEKGRGLSIRGDLRNSNSVTEKLFRLRL